MAIQLTTATLRWFEDNCCDVKYLDMWHDSPLTFDSSQPIDESWHKDHHQQIVAHDPQGGLFERAVDHLMRYHFYPPHIMSHISHFSLDDRWLQIGDRIAQRIHLCRIGRFPILDVMGMTEITAVTTTQRRYGFTYTTVAAHAEQGEWSAEIAWLDNYDVCLTVKAISRPSIYEPRRNHRLMRFYQKRAHLAGFLYFQQLIREQHWHLQPV